MLVKASKVVRRVTGTDVTVPVSPPVLRWLEAVCRDRLRDVVNDFCEDQPEPLDPEHLVVDKVTAEAIHCRIPAMVTDSESPHPFESEVAFELNPVTGACTRLGVGVGES